MGITRTTLAGLCAVLVAALLAGDLSAASPKERLRQKRAEADAVLAQVNTLNQSLEASVEAWNGARYELDVTRRELVVDRRRLRVAERQRRVAIARVAARLRSLYESSDDDQSTLGILLGSTSISEILDRVDAARAVADADKRLTEQATAARNKYAHAARVAAAVVRRRTVALDQRDRERTRIATMLDEHKRLLASVQSEVDTLQAQEAAQQARLRIEARARLAAEERARRAEAARAAEEAKARAAVTTPAVPIAPPPSTTVPPTTTAPVTTTAAPPPIAPAGPGHPEAATIALRYLGIPYLWGGASPATGFDCSGLVMYVYAQLGISLPHYAAAQYQLGAPVARDQLAPGDLVFFDALDHVGIYIGGDQFVHAPQTGDVVKITPMSAFASSYVGARRL